MRWSPKVQRVIEGTDGYPLETFLAQAADSDPVGYDILVCRVLPHLPVRHVRGCRGHGHRRAVPLPGDVVAYPIFRPRR